MVNDTEQAMRIIESAGPVDRIPAGIFADVCEFIYYSLNGKNLPIS